MSKIERFITNVEVEESQEKLLGEFRYTYEREVLDVTYKGENIYHDEYPG